MGPGRDDGFPCSCVLISTPIPPVHVHHPTHLQELSLSAVGEPKAKWNAVELGTQMPW